MSSIDTQHRERLQISYWRWHNAGVNHVQASSSQLLQEENGDFTYLSIDGGLVLDPNRKYSARVKGDSMRGASLLDSDMVVVQKTAPTIVGGLVDPVEDGKLTVKHLRQEHDDRLYLQPTSTAFADIFPVGEFEILGFVGSIHPSRR